MAYRCTASQNGAIPHINRRIYSTEATSKSCLQLFILQCSYFAKKKQKMIEPYEETCYLWTRSEIRSPFYMVQSQTGTKITRVGSATDTKSDRSKFIFSPVPCKRVKRNVWRLIRTHTGLSSFRSHVITSLI